MAFIKRHRCIKTLLNSEVNEVLFDYHLEQNNLLTIDQASVILGQHPTNIKNMICRGEIQPIYLRATTGKKIIRCFITKLDIDNFFLEKKMRDFHCKTGGKRKPSNIERKQIAIKFTREQFTKIGELIDLGIIKSIDRILIAQFKRFLKNIASDPTLLTKLKGEQKIKKDKEYKQFYAMWLPKDFLFSIDALGFTNRSWLFRYVIQDFLNAIERNRKLK